MNLKTTLLFFLLLVSSNVCKSVEYFTYADALVAAKENNQKILLYAGTDWCDYCKKMELVLADETVAQELLNREYIVVKLNVDQNKDLKTKLGIKTIPDLMILDKNGKVLKRYKGYKNKESFVKWLDL